MVRASTAVFLDRAGCAWTWYHVFVSVGNDKKLFAFESGIFMRSFGNRVK